MSNESQLGVKWTFSLKVQLCITIEAIMKQIGALGAWESHV